MGKRSGVFIAIAAITMTILIWGNPITRIRSVLLPEIPAITPSIQTYSNLNLIIDQTQLLNHVSNVSQTRATPDQKPPIRNYITQVLTSYGLSPFTQRYNHPQTGSLAAGGINIISELAGSDSAAGVIILGAHYDSQMGSPGADDNGSAIATLLEAARLFSEASSSSPFTKTLKLVFFDQEEQQPDGSGLLGSLAFTQLESNIANVQGAVILDMIGYACHVPGCQQYPEGLPLQNVPNTGDFLAVLGLSTHTELIGAFLGSAQTNWPLVLSLPIPQATLRFFPNLLRSDHAPFWERDIPAIFVTDTANFRNPNYHTASDTPETLDPSFFTGSAQHIVNVVATLLSQSS
ncbi:peptidase, M28 family [Synechococcus sp. PCC 7335]|uniref:M28 family peptidase n=1 Tax=Synechococcus sp. (strain ATCC 29403 / PCC 7335) TaxID=91464 RepID=UPI00017EC72C|nr:M28 family peptidase [Synechococcus sp. PCC 7335]EDX85728.1 peptidase, M28 family [Synechococcus sp. PCC 7335]